MEDDLSKQEIITITVCCIVMVIVVLGLLALGVHRFMRRYGSRPYVVESPSEAENLMIPSHTIHDLLDEFSNSGSGSG